MSRYGSSRTRSSRGKRKENNRGKPKNRILIVCEGEKTEPNYFKAFPIRKGLTEIVIHGTGTNTKTLVKKAEQLFIEDKERDNGLSPFDQVWCVFDRDSFHNGDFNAAINMVKAKPQFRVACSNEAFELWYILHFNYLDTAINRSRYNHILNDLFKKHFHQKYEKNLESTYSLLLSRQPTAIQNAEQLLEKQLQRQVDHESMKPFTRVHDLVKELNTLIK